MPRDWGVNTKAQEAKAREAEKKKAAADKKQKEAEDAYWKDDDKHAQRKIDRKEEKQKKHEEEIKRKQETRKLLEMESEQMKANKPSAATASRPTRAQVEAAREKAEQEERKRLGVGNVATKSPNAELNEEIGTEVSDDIKKNHGNKKSRVGQESDDSDSGLPPIQENINRILALNLGDGSARNVDEALVLLGDPDDDSDAHPERRMKKAHLEFESQMLAKLKVEYPNMRLSQLRQLVWKEWQRAPQNPLNIAAKSVGDKATSS